MLQIKIPSNPDTVQAVTLNEEDYFLRFKFFTRDASWRMFLLDFSGSPIISNNKIVEEFGLLRYYHISSPDLPSGELIVFKIDDVDEPINADNFGEGKAYRLFYLTQEELTEGVV